MSAHTFLLFSLCLPAWSQSLHIGAVGGANLTTDVRAGTETTTGQTPAYTNTIDRGRRRPILGLSFDLPLTTHLGIEFQALHRELKSTSTIDISPPIEYPGGTLARFGPSTRTLTTWEFPLLAKYTFSSGRRVKPFVTAGASFRPAGSGTGLSHAGITTGGGIAFHTAAGFRISPTLRFTRWAYRPIGYTIGAPLLNQLELLVTIDRPSAERTVSVFGQPVSLGLLAGIGLGDDFLTGYAGLSLQSESNSGIFGVMSEVGLPRNLAIEIDGLYRPLHGSAPEFIRRVRFAHLTWEFPALLKYRLPALSRLTPFLAGGPSFRAEGNLNLYPTSHYGAITAAGLELHLGPLKIAPQARYTRWSGDSPPTVPRVALNQFHLIAAFAF